MSEHKNVYGYVRVSTRSQDYETQADNLKKYCAFKDYTLVNIFADTKSGKDTVRTGYQSMVSVLNDQKNPQGISMIVATKIDRIGRSLIDLIKFSEWCKVHNIDLVFTQSNIDTSTTENRMFFGLMAIIAEYERERIVERTAEGRDRYIAGGGKLGKPKLKMDIYEIKRLMVDGVPKSKIAKKFKCSVPTIYARLAEAEQEEIKLREAREQEKR
jgi:DNA invertase Pin-like site-specific DNA recombinase